MQKFQERGGEKGQGDRILWTERSTCPPAVSQSLWPGPGAVLAFREHPRLQLQGPRRLGCVQGAPCPGLRPGHSGGEGDRRRASQLGKFHGCASREGISEGLKLLSWGSGLLQCVCLCVFLCLCFCVSGVHLHLCVFLCVSLCMPMSVCAHACVSMCLCSHLFVSLCELMVSAGSHVCAHKSLYSHSGLPTGSCLSPFTLANLPFPH